MNNPSKAIRQARKAGKKAQKALKAAKKLQRDARKASAPGITKTASVTVIKAAQRQADRRARRRCWNGCAAINKVSAKYCVGCGERLGITYAQHVERTIQKARFGVIQGGPPPDPQAAFIAKSQGYQSVRDAWLHETDPGLHELYRRGLYGGGAA